MAGKSKNSAEAVNLRLNAPTMIVAMSAATRRVAADDGRLLVIQVHFNAPERDIGPFRVRATGDEYSPAI